LFLNPRWGEEEEEEEEEDDDDDDDDDDDADDLHIAPSLDIGFFRFLVFFRPYEFDAIAVWHKPWKSFVPLSHTHAYMHTCIHTYMHAYMHTYMHTHIHTCMHTYIHTHIGLYVVYAIPHR
jgi:hypothetical protein